jgi:hypothetical protein
MNNSLFSHDHGFLTKLKSFCLLPIGNKQNKRQKAQLLAYGPIPPSRSVPERREDNYGKARTDLSLSALRLPTGGQGGKGSSIGSLETNSKQPELSRRYYIIGERRLSNYWWACVIFLGGLGFLLTGISSYLKYNILAKTFNMFNSMLISNYYNPGLAENIPNPLSPGGGLENSVIAFFPQGLLMCFYGSLGILLSLYWCLRLYWDIGGGFNEFNKKEGFMRIFRWGYPGKNRRIDLVYPLEDIEAIRVEFKQTQGLFASEQTIYVRLLSTPLSDQNTLSGSRKGVKEKIEIPLGGIGQPLTLKEIEKQASELANFLQVGLEGL